MLNEKDYPALLLNADFRVMSYAPLSTVSWQDAVGGVLSGSHVAVAEYDRVVCSPSIELRLPAVVMSRTYVNRLNLPVPLTRMALMLVSDYRCAYCGKSFSGQTEMLTFDHVLPRARGGATSWGNLLLACQKCNQRKGCRTPAEAGMKPLWRPRQPSRAEMDRLMLRHQRHVRVLHASWVDFLYWDGALGEDDA